MNGPNAIFATVAAVLLFAGGCDLVEYHPYDTRITGRTGINAANARRIDEACAGRRSIRFALVSDTQRWYDHTRDAVASINRLEGIGFVIHCGDLSDFGATKEFLWQRDILEGLRVPYVCLLGNHDCLGTGEEVFAEVFGPPDFAFTAGPVRFVCLNTNAMEFDYSRPVPDFGFIGRELEHFPSGVGRTVFAMHVQPGEFQFNNNVARVFEWYLNQFPGLECCLFGHGHHMAALDLFGDGVMWYAVSSIEKRQYLVFTVDEQGHAYETVDF